VLEDRTLPGTVSFSAPVGYNVGPGGFWSVALGDFNGDGKLDLAVANGEENSISVFLGNGDGTFQSAKNTTVGLFPSPIAVGDFNGDGAFDLAFQNEGNSGRNSNVTVLLGNGDGTFRTGQNLAVGYVNVAPAVGDFNGDGKLDLAIASPTTSSINVFLGNGDGTFQTAKSFAVGPINSAPVAGDVNGDGKLDLVVGGGVLLGNGDGTFQPIHYFFNGAANSLALQDLNGDGKLDLVYTTTFPSDSVNVMLGNGDGTFQPVQSYALGSSPHAVAVGDFNGDGKLDLVADAGSGFASSQLSVLLGNGDGTFQPAQSYSVGAYAGAVAVGDFNGDGKADLALPGGNDGNGVNVQLSAFGTTTAITGPATWTYGQPAIYTATVTSSAGAVAGGTVTFLDGNTPVSPALPLNANGQASFNMAILTAGVNAGNHTITAAYSGSPGRAGITPFAPSTAVTSATVSPAPLSASAVNFSATAGAAFNQAVATFVNADPYGSASAYFAYIDWGDGTPLTACTITGTGTLKAAGSHTYSDPGSYAATVHIYHLLGNTTSAIVYPTATVTSLGQNVQNGLEGGIGLWHNKNGQALIDSFNGGPNSTVLSTWLVSNFGNLYGPNGNDLTGATNAQVAAFYQQLFALPGSLDAQVLATALNIYATTLSLGGTIGQSYGFTVSADGLGADSWNVGADGAAFGVANNTTLNVYSILQAVNDQAFLGVLYNGNTTLRNQAGDLFSVLMQAGSLK
jgi:hypothetical protein